MQKPFFTLLTFKFKILAKIFFLLLFIASLQVNGQRIEFSQEDDEVFLAQLSYIANGLDRTERANAQLLIDSFSSLWMNEILSESQKEWIFQTLNVMQTLRLRPWPEQAQYLQGVIGVMKTSETNTNFEAWHQSFQPLLNLQTQRRLVSFWQASIQLFENNIIYSSSLLKWVLQNNNYALTFDNGIAKIIIRGGDLKCYAQRDSTVIYNTRGEVHILDETFYGNTGKITWERVKADPQKVYANLDSYRINLPSANWQADSVTFYNHNFFQEPLHGKLTERIIAETTTESARFPRFESYQAVHEIKNLFKGIDFRGGFTMEGARILGSGNADGDATIKIYRSDSLFITARGRSFSILSDRIVTQNTAVSIYLSGDSIFHPNIQMRYLDPSREFSLLRDDKGFSKAPFINSFHKIDMYCEAIYWNIDTYDINLRMIRSISETGEAFFESQDYFSEVRYMRMQGMAQLHPLIRLRNFGREYNSNTFFIAEYANYIRADVASVSSQLLTFSQDGFLTYNQDDETVTLENKLFHYITSYAGRSDFDVIRINSTAPINAQLNMNNFDLKLFGVERIPLSNKKNVVIHPSNQQVVMKKDRDIYFDGRIESGLFDFYGKEFFFNYEQFKIELLQTDSMSFRIQSFEPDSRGNHPLVRVRTILEGINGELLVDHPLNKSGQLPYPRFPIFNSNNESFVYYDRDFVQEGVYKRDDVFFKLIPFSIDSLDNATTDNIAFDGVFISTGIFPDFYDYLTVQKDYSLGFNTKTPEDGYTVYGGKALYKGPIDMSYEGLRTDGELEYLNANIFANQMIMFPDSARGKINTFNLKAQDTPIEYPEVSALDVNMLYLPHQDNMNFWSTTHPFDVYSGLAMLKGSMNLTPDGITGKGELEFFGGKMASNDFDFKLRDFEADNTDLTLLTADGSQTAVIAESYATTVSFETLTTKLRNREKESMLDFVLNRYSGQGFDVDWDMDDKTLKVVNTLQDEVSELGELSPAEWINHDFTGHELVSTHAAQAGLAFYAGAIDYSLHNNEINASDVKIIKVADAAIYPENEKVRILQRAEMERLENAFIIANTTSQLYSFYDATVNIASRWEYTGSAMHDFVDESGKTQPINFEAIAVDRANRSTIAVANIEKEQDFVISPQFGYHGKIDLKAENPNFFYTGAAQIFVDCPLYNPNWLRFEAELKKDSVVIPLAEDLRNDANGRIQTSLMLAGDSVHIYPALFDRQKHYSDLPLITASGYLAWDRDLRQYQVTTAEKLRRSTLPDNIITINPNTCIVDAHGDIVLSQDLGQFKMNTFGRISHNLKEDDVNLDIVMGINFHFINSALAMVESNINESEKTTPVNLNRFKYSSFLHKKTNEETARTLIDDFVNEGAFRRFPLELNHTFFFADLRMKWDQNATTFYTTQPIGIGNMERFPMNKYTDGFLELNKTRAGDIFNMVLIPSGLADEGVGIDWFFFTYSQGVMQTISSNNEFNNIIRNVKTNRRRMTVERGEEPFTFILSSDRRPFDFVRSMRFLL